VKRRASSRPWALLVNVIAASPIVSVNRRKKLWRLAGMTIPDHVNLRPHCWVYSDQLTIGAGTLIGHRCHFENRELPIIIGRHCSLADQVTIGTSTHEIGPHEQRAGAVRADASVVVEDGCWIGTRALLLPGVRIGAGCVIGAGAVVTRDCAPDGVYAGVPARRLRDLPLSRSATAR
jgi:maltose O-acetyltransferase